MDEEKVEETSENTDWPLVPFVIAPKVVSDLCKGLTKLADSVRTMVKGVYDIFANAVSNKRTLHLSKHGKGRTKKKNLNRIREDIHGFFKQFNKEKNENE